MNGTLSGDATLSISSLHSQFSTPLGGHINWSVEALLDSQNNKDAVEKC